MYFATSTHTMSYVIAVVTTIVDLAHKWFTKTAIDNLDHLTKI